MINAIKDQAKKFQIVWDLGRRCTYSCSYCSPTRNNKWSPLVTFDELKANMKNLDDYIGVMDSVRKEKMIKGLSFTGGEPTIHPEFFKFLEYIKTEYPEYKKAITTNGVFGKRLLDKCKRLTDTGTISYHPEGTAKEKKMVIHNMIELGRNNHYKVNVMFHKDYFEECKDICALLKKENIPFVPRIIGDEANDSHGVKMGYAHVYTDEQMDWFKSYWKKPPAPKTKDSNTQKSLGRPCCGNRVFGSCDSEHGWKNTKFLENTNFFGWNCMINWYFIYIHQELDLVWTHQTCGVNLDGEVGPLGKWSEFDKVVDTLEEHIIENGTMPVVKCPKTFCGCGMCIDKAKDDVTAIELFNDHVNENIKPKLQVGQKISLETEEKLTKWAFKRAGILELHNEI